jgi:hypothetical protein
VHEKPARALSKVGDKENHEGKDGPEEEGHPSRLGNWEMGNHREREDSLEERARPIGPVDGDVDPSPLPRRDELVDSRIARGVPAADTHAGNKARHVKPQHPPPGRPGMAAGTAPPTR